MNKELTSVNCMGYPVFSGSLDFLPDQPKVLVNTINQYSYCMAEKDVDFKRSLLEADILLPDGIGIVAATRFLSGVKVAKIAGADLHQHLLKDLNKKGGKCFYLGSSTKTLAKIQERLAVEYPSVQAVTYSPPYKSNFSEEDNALMLEAINGYKPDVLFVGMTAPKQEKWVHTHKEFLDVKVICSIGAVFDFYAGTVERPDKFWINMGLEWLGRLVKEPKRMWKRYLYYGPVFAASIFKAKSRQTFSTSSSL